VFASYLIRLVVDRQKALPRFVAAYINSEAGRSYIQSHLTRAIGQVNVNATKLSAMPVPFPDTSTQEGICAFLRSTKGDLREMRSLQAQDLKLLDQLERTILERSFRGEM